MTSKVLDPVTLDDLNEKIDRLTAQIEFLTEEAEMQRRRREDFDELRADVVPIANDIFFKAVNELEDLEHDVQVEDIIRVFKRLLRNTHNIESALIQLESLQAMWEDANPLANEMFLKVMNQLDVMERKGYFTFVQGGLAMTDRIITEFDEDDVQQLADNVVLILRTVKEMTQPEIMTMMQRTATVVRDEDPSEVSTLGLLRQMNDPEVKRGLAKILKVLKSMGHE